MKKILLFAAIATTLASCSKERLTSDNSTGTTSTASSTSSRIEDNNATPPPAVLNAFVATFGRTTVNQWKLRSDGTYRAHFLKNGIAWEATFTASGTLVKSEAAR